MNIAEIIAKQEPPYHEMEYVITEYIFERKNVRIAVQVPTDAIRHQMFIYAYICARDYYLNTKK